MKVGDSHSYTGTTWENQDCSGKTRLYNHPLGERKEGWGKEGKEKEGGREEGKGIERGRRGKKMSMVFYDLQIFVEWIKLVPPQLITSSLKTK